MKQIEIRLPKSIKDLRIHHLEALSGVESDNITDEGIIKFVAKFANVTEQEVLTIIPKDVVRMYNHLVDIWSEYKVRNTPPEEITINGKTYRRANPAKEGYGWHIAWKNAVKSEDKVKRACVMYVPFGVYGAVDENKNTINPISERYDDFKKHFPLTTYLEASSFFLRKSQQSMKRSILQRMSHQKRYQSLKHLRKRN